MLRILIADDHAIVREGLKQIVSTAGDMRVEGEADTAAQTLDLIRERRWDVAVIDINLPDRSGLDLIEQIRLEQPELPLLILSMHSDSRYATRSLKRGAAGYVTKDAARDVLVKAIRRVASGERFLSPDIAEAVAFGLLGAERETPLSDREFEVLRMIATGSPPRESAAKLGVSVKTIATHRTRILQKLELRTNAELVQYAIEQKMMP